MNAAQAQAEGFVVWPGEQGRAEDPRKRDPKEDALDGQRTPNRHHDEGETNHQFEKVPFALAESRAHTTWNAAGTRRVFSGTKVGPFRARWLSSTV